MTFSSFVCPSSPSSPSAPAPFFLSCFFDYIKNFIRTNDDDIEKCLPFIAN
jgi:hypothetical protein